MALTNNEQTDEEAGGETGGSAFAWGKSEPLQICHIVTDKILEQVVGPCWWTAS